MAAQPPAPPRPWFRLPSIARPAAPAPTPAPAPPPPQPRPPLVRPAFRPVAPPPPPPTPATPPPTPAAAGVASVTSSPRASAAPSASLPTSPAAPTTITTSVPSSPLIKPATIVTSSSVPASPDVSKAVITTTTTTVEPVAAVQSPLQAAKRKPTTPPPSPLTLPPSQVKPDAKIDRPKIPLEAEQKTVVVQKTIDHNAAAVDSSGHKSSIAPRLDSEDSGVRVITIAGENRGAYMEVIHSPNKKAFEGNSYSLQKKATATSSSSEEEGMHKKKDKCNKGKTTSSSSSTRPMSAFMNSNVQGVNNSIVFNSSCTHHDPGLHLTLSKRPAGAGFDVKDHGNNGLH